ncbi:MAG: type II toxin-antitoxin system HicA family toxin [Candidatus Microgenomates bacterium]|jgi:predicted RNA binding protein YcfA (HicA-like mRNA interferase family)
MPKLYSAKELLKAFKRAGFYKVSQKGSHIKLRGIWREKLQTVIVPNHKQIAFGTLKSILNQASMTIDELKEYLR